MNLCEFILLSMMINLQGRPKPKPNEARALGPKIYWALSFQKKFISVTLGCKSTTL
ncbi:hypothetical protein HanIR_Chr07g0329191 [Helianthus annuus]|nr:hypothetical protein HanIR_Chr07g0329191 [Helianthus annuus]